MRKILFGLLGIIGLLSAFATPSWAACNLFHLEPQTLYNGVTLTIRDDGAYVLNGTCEASGNFLIGLQSLGAGTYTLAVIDRELDPDMGGTQVQVHSPSDIGTNMAVKMDSGANYVTRTFDTDYNNVQYRIRIQEGITYDNYVIKPILVKGSTAPTEYTPYNPLCATCDGTIVNYTSATGTVVQNGTPTPENPIEPTFYTQGNMVLRKVGNYADSYDATTGKITRRVGVKVFDGTEEWGRIQSTYNNKVYYAALRTLSGAPMSGGNNSELSTVVCNILPYKAGIWYSGEDLENGISGSNGGNGIAVSVVSTYPTVNDWTSYLAQQYAAGTPVTVYYPLATEVVEDWTGGTSYCQQNIRVATTKYVETQFSDLGTRLAAAVATVNTVVSNTITQAASIATLQSGKQTRPDETCPAGKKCLLVEDASGVPHWYEIVEPLVPAGYTQLQWIESTGTQYIDTGIKANASIVVDMGVLFSRIGSTSVALGTRNGTNTSDTNVFQFGINSNNTFFHRYGISTSDGTGVPVAQTLYDVHLENYKEIISNGQDTYTNTFEFNPDMDTGGTLYIFATNDISSSGRIFSMAGYITYLSISVDGVLVRDFIPAKNPDGVVGMYDTVSGQFFTNQGTGEFTAGPVAE